MNLVFAGGFLVPQQILGSFEQFRRLPILGSLEYFRGLKELFERGGKYFGKHIAIFPPVSPLATSANRAEELARGIPAGFAEAGLHIIAHSMGGLDSRNLIVNNPNGLSARIKSLTTISTPHSGSPVPDLLVGGRPDDERREIYDKVAGVIAVLGGDAGALADLTTTGAKATPDPRTSHPDIRYRAYACVGRPVGSGLLSFLGLGSKKTSKPLLPTHDYIQTVTSEENDGLVQFSSSQYPDPRHPEFQTKIWQCDHADAVGWNLDNPLSSQFDHLTAYGSIITDLEELFRG